MPRCIDSRTRTHSRATWFCGMIGLGAALIGPAARAEHLLPTDVQQIIAQAALEASRRNAPATIAVVDRDGNVLAVYRMNGANLPFFFPNLRVVFVAPNSHGPNTGLNGVPIIDTGAVITKAITGAYLSSSGNAFSTRTASQIVQDHFNPGQLNAPSGPLYGVQFSQLPCSDVNRRSVVVDPTALSLGPKRSPFGLSADPGGFPLYKNGQNVGGVGVIADGIYGDDENIFNVDKSTDEIIALAATSGFSAPASIRADRISAGGLTLRYSDAVTSDILSNPAQATLTAALSQGVLVSVNGYYSASQGFLGGQEHGTVASGLTPDQSGAYSTVTPPLLMVNADGSVRYPARAGRIPGGLSALEVATILREAYQLTLKARAAIRNPLGSQVAVTISVVDANGEILGSVTNPDAPVFGIDVSVQKARSALLMSGPYIHDVLSLPSFTSYLTQAQSFYGANIMNGTLGFSARAIGNLARDTYPDGIGNTPYGPFGAPVSTNTPFSDGLQEALIQGDLVRHAQFLSTGTPDVGAACTRGIVPAGPNSASGQPILADGLQIFPGGFGVYRGNALIGGVGVSGDGVDQDDMTAFLGLYNAGIDLGNGLGHVRPEARVSFFATHGARPIYVNCPTTPLLNSSVQNLCTGK
ncbi:MAG: hypothetical protein JWO51_5142 [Rhodospirillales bacterium]|nr:hypothetical protein [Rhodospirillales bacterium]